MYQTGWDPVAAVTARLRGAAHQQVNKPSVSQPFSRDFLSENELIHPLQVTAQLAVGVHITLAKFLYKF